MDIVIGPACPAGSGLHENQPLKSGFVEAKMLSVREPRSHPGSPPVGQRERRGEKQTGDPINGRVLTLLIPEGYKIPRDIDSDNYRVFIRFTRR